MNIHMLSLNRLFYPLNLLNYLLVTFLVILLLHITICRLINYYAFFISMRFGLTKSAKLKDASGEMAWFYKQHKTITHNQLTWWVFPFIHVHVYTVDTLISRKTSIFTKSEYNYWLNAFKWLLFLVQNWIYDLLSLLVLGRWIFFYAVNVREFEGFG